MKKFTPISNFHMHTNFSDGKANPEEYVISAIKKGFKVIGFSDHAPISVFKNNWNMPVEQVDPYFSEIKRLKEKYKDQIEIYLGFEMDYLPTNDEKLIQDCIDQVDYTVGSVHYLYDEGTKKYYAIEGSPEEVKEAFDVVGQGSSEIFVKKYYQELVRVIKKYQPNIVGHFDIIKKRNYDDRYFNQNEDWYHDIVKRSLDELVSTKSAIEVSTGGKINNGITELYPSKWILEEMLVRDIPIVLNSDSHKPEDVDGFFEEAVDLLKQIGFAQQRILLGGKWIDVDLD